MQLAVFVDGENISADHAADIWKFALDHAQPILSRVYGDAGRLAKWEEEPNFSLFHSGKGKNATDLLFCLDAFEFGLSGVADAILLASSDRDFCHLALRLREKGLQVIGVGEAKTNAKFRAACSVFHLLHPKAVAPPAPVAPILKHQPALVLVPKAAPLLKTKLDDKIREIIAAQSGNGAGMPLTELSNKLHVDHKDIAATRKEKTWRSYLGARPHLYALDPKGPTAKVRIVTKAITSAATG